MSKGSDASWKNDIEPPSNLVDYSDDEKERSTKRKAKANRTGNGQEQREFMRGTRHLPNQHQHQSNQYPQHNPRQQHNQYQQQQPNLAYPNYSWHQNLPQYNNNNMNYYQNYQNYPQ